MLIDHSSAAVFLLELPQMTYKYYNNVAKQVQQPSIFQVSITMVSLYQACGGSFSQQKITRKIPSDPPSTAPTSSLKTIFVLSAFSSGFFVSCPTGGFEPLVF